ncbi:hypothetical protein FB45DRAFT_1032514 [Roridomyces roridus]|uniref:Apple domain-containing protein n=1 Tax=Roridomyces roridus TaxID=1738132 RepID=A0AAD7FFK8_9AGAR|nr:hypothetical protein FB45DRAFT_1032514 [Roridomyces roridus]
MRSTAFFTAFCLFVSAASVSASAIALPDAEASVKALNRNGHYGAPTPPWEGGAPGWYFGRPENAPKGLLCLVDNLLCLILSLLDLCPNAAPTIPPPPPPVGSPPQAPDLPGGYNWVFTNLTCAAQNPSYETFGIAETFEDCAIMCNSVSGCACANSYHDNNAGAGKDFTTELTCSLFDGHITAADAINCGKQQQQSPPVGVTVITESYAYCRNGQ